MILCEERKPNNIINKLPTSTSAIWLLPARNGYGEWPASGEIDLVESRGKEIRVDFFL